MSTGRRGPGGGGLKATHLEISKKEHHQFPLKFGQCRRQIFLGEFKKKNLVTKCKI